MSATTPDGILNFLNEGLLTTMNPSKRPANDTSQRAQTRADRLLFIVFAVFVILSILGMMAIDFYGQEQMGDATMVRPDAVGK
jgi:hypothetical protein